MATGEISHGGRPIPGWLRTTEANSLSASSARMMAIGIASTMIALGVWLLASGSQRPEPVADAVVAVTPASAAAPGQPSPNHAREDTPAVEAPKPPAPESAASPGSGDAGANVANGTHDGEADEAAADPNIVPEEVADAADAADVPTIGEGSEADIATADARPSAARDPAAAVKLVEKADAAYKSGKRSTARRLLDEALALDEGSAEALIGLSNLSFDSGKFSSAASYARRAVNLAPRNADYRLRLGDAYFKLEQNDRARAQYERAAKLGHPFAARRIERLPPR